MITDILKYKIAAINKKYKQLHDEIRRKENKIRELVMWQLSLENDISDLDKELEELEISVIEELDNH